MSEVLIDTSAWIEYVLGTAQGSTVCDLVEEREATISILTIAEFSCWLAANGKNGDEHVAFLQDNARILPLSVSVCKAVGTLKRTHRKQEKSFGTSDALIYLTAREHNLTLLTKDKDFAGLDGVRIL